jgi:uncharacterized membrane protein YgaE (UPF0421/DUF939 family)
MTRFIQIIIRGYGWRIGAILATLTFALFTKYF